MTLEKREHPEAREELREAAHWYEDRELGLGEDFYKAVDEAIAQISNWPHSAPIFPRWAGTPAVRSMAVSAFPYRVLYFVAQERFVILAYAHERRKPWYWRHRIVK